MFVGTRDFQIADCHSTVNGAYFKKQQTDIEFARPNMFDDFLIYTTCSFE